VGVSVYQDLGVWEGLLNAFGCRRAELVAVGDHDPKPIQLDASNLRKPRADVESVDVSIHGGHRGQRLELGQEVERTQIAGVKNVVHVAEDVEDLGTQQAVGVCDDAEAHGKSYPLSDTALQPRSWATDSG